MPPENVEDEVLTEECCYCGELHDSEDSLVLDANIYCSRECAENDDWYRCADCDIWTQDNCENNEGEYICSSCAEDYRSCDDCGDLFRDLDIFYDEERGGYYCEDCGRNTALIHDHGYRPKDYVFTKCEGENTLYLGIELEVEAAPYKSIDSLVDKLQAWLVKNEMDKFVYFKEDGSLEDGVEIVFHPTTLKAIKQRFKIKEMLAYMKEIGFRSHDSGRCGLHVHLSRKKMADYALVCGRVFFYVARDLIFKLSRRDADRGLRYCKFDDKLYNNVFDMPNGRYAAFNPLATDDTAEVRVFRGTLDYEEFMASLEFCDLFASYIQDSKERQNMTDWATFVKMATKLKYKVLLAQLKKMALI